ALQRAAARERFGQLREGRPAHSGPDRHRERPARGGPSAAGHVGRCPGEGAVSASQTDYLETGWTGGRNPWAIAFVVTLATFMEVLDTSIANVSLPHIAGSLSATQEESTWVLTSYLVSNAVILPISGWLATRIGRKRFYMISVTLFVVSSFLCGIAPTLP